MRQIGADSRRLRFHGQQRLGSVVGPHVEVVLHDLTRPERSIVALADGHVSNRRVGQSIHNYLEALRARNGDTAPRR